MLRISQTAIVLLALSMPLFADFSYKTETQVTGGAMAGAMRMATRMSKTARSAMEGATYIKGNRMATQTGDSVTVMDLDTETVTNIDHAKKQYSVVTFQEYQQYMEQLSQKMQGNKKNDGNIRYSVKIKDGQKQQSVYGYPANLTIFSLHVESDDSKGKSSAMEMVNDMWLSRDIAGSAEMEAFGRKMAEKIASASSQNFGAMGAMIQQQGGADALREFQENASKLEGVPVLTVVRLGPAGTADSLMAQAGKMPEEKPEGNDENAPSVGNVLRGMGGLGGLGRGRNREEAPKPAAGNASQALIEMAMKSFDFSTSPIADSQFQTPSGYKQVESDMKKALR